MSGRVSAVAARNGDGKTTVFVGAASGGVWKSEDGGTRFKPVFDKQPVQSIGADRDRSLQPEDGLGRHGRVLDAQLRLGRRRRLQVHRRGRDLDEHGPARVGAHRADRGRSQERRHGVRLRAGQALERQRGARPLQDGRRRQDVEPGAQGCEPLDRLRFAGDGPEEPGPPLRRHVGFPPQGVDVPLGRRGAGLAERQRPLRIAGRREELDGADGQDERGPPGEALGARRGRGRAVGPEDRLRPHRVGQVRALPLRRRRQDLGSARPEPDDGLASLLFRAAGRRSGQRRPGLQAGRQASS